MLHYATADVAASGCANCHNGRGDSPKRDFEVGDLMGILVTSTLVTGDPELSKSLLAGKDKFKNFEKTGKLFDVTLEALRFGGITYVDLGMTREVNLPDNEDAAIEEKLAEVASSWDELKTAARNVQQEKVNSSEYLRELAIIRSQSLKMLKSMNEAMKLYTDRSQNNTVAMMYAEGVILLISLIAGIAFALLLTRNLTGALNSGLDVAQKISQGDFSSVIEIKSNDETGQLLQSLQVMQDNLKERIEADALVAQVNGRIKTALDSVGANVMLADVDMNIIYMNNAVTKMMKDAETKLRESLPGFDADKLIGANIDSFHKNPSHQRALMADLKTPYQGTAEISGLTFMVIANPVFSDDGERIGTVVEWNNQTAELAVENEISEIVSAAAAGDFSER
ncbi:MAG: HAMP domain-containing protein, partial [Gammaproteobacteria bacterium]|nr:HAMP domain-containing protein [Gammaproteobacteria bacterium]